MFCGKCNNDLIKCTCDDLEERLNNISSHPNIGLNWCINCDKHYARCKCGSPEYRMKIGGKILPLQQEN